MKTKRNTTRITSAPRNWWWSRYFVGRLALWKSLTPLIPHATDQAPFLDAGCGVRPFNELLKGLGHRVVGVDLAEESPADTRASIQRLPFGDETFSGAVCASVLQYVPDPTEACREIGRVLQPGGKAVFGVPCVVPIDPLDRWRWTEHSARAMLEEAGFTDLVCSPIGTTPTTLLHGLALGARKSIPVIGVIFGVLFDLVALAGLKIKDFSLPGAYAICATKPVRS